MLPASRADFLLGRAAMAVYYLMTLVRGQVDSKYSSASTTGRSVAWSLPYVVVFGVQTYYVQLQYAVLSLPAVAARPSRPADWLPIVGDLAEAGSVRKFWGQYWHQMLRRMFDAWNGAFRDACGFHPVTPRNITVRERTVGLLAFFFGQATIIRVPLVGYAWIVCTRWYSMGWAGDVFLRLRLAKEPLFPFTFWGGLMETWVPRIRDRLVS
ncbi:hypothetical protein MFIFM68171_09437 [Madurella fahalii]|uniref:Wax synthase domain-containing protein n=1 Tax=Madurella fahalii TaxID=1157608 RepID=A0ABQ0GN83_9PEZI